MSKHNANTMTLPNDDGLMLSGYQKKLKTMKKKFFVLYKDTQNNTARLEYYDNERKFKSGLPPKRSIRLRNCFSINRRLDTKHDFVIALSTKDGGFGIVLDTEDEMLRWLEVLISLQRANFNITEQLRPQYEHVWQVYVQRKGLAESKGIIGNYHVCLTGKSLTYVRIGADRTSDGTIRIDHVEFQLTTIRRCGDSQCYFYMEVGRQSVIGPGELWMETEDSLTAQNMHRMILSAMSAKVDMNNMGPMQRKRSSSANEASKPINVLQIKQTYVDNKYNNVSPQTSSIIFGRERCDSLPTRNRTSSENTNHSFTLPSVLHTILGGRNNSLTANLRQHSFQRHSNSPPVSSAAIGCSESEESSISIDEPDDNGSFMPYRFNSRSSDGVIPEENTDEIGSSDTSAKCTDLLSSQVDVVTLAENYVNMAPVIAKSQAVMSSSAEEAKYNMQQHAVNSPVRSSPRSTIEFAECAVDHVAKIVTPDDDTQNLERPTRCYSIGSRSEHNRIFKHMGGGLGSADGGGGGVSGMNTATNDNEHTTSVRVRAFSVGSRAKIPRCDLQRGVLSPKLLFEQQQHQQIHCHSHNSSNSNINVGGATQLSSSTSFSYKNNNLFHHRDTKSISAPLLIHKSQNSVDRMSDLMEIDFSLINNKQSSNSTINRNNLNTSVPSTTTKTTETAIILPAHASSSTSSLVGKTQTTTTIEAETPISSSTTSLSSIAFNNNNNNNNNNNKNYHNNYKQNSNSKSSLTTITTPESTTMVTLNQMTTTTTTATITAAAGEKTAVTTSNNNNNNNNNVNNNNNRNSLSFKKKYNTITAITTSTNFSKQPLQTAVSTTDNGYLEMKPVGSQSAPPITTIKTQVNITKKQPQHQQYKKQQQRNGNLFKQQQQKPKITMIKTTSATPLQLSQSTAINESIVGVDIPPDRSKKTTNLNINANINTPTESIAITNNTVLVNNQQIQAQQQQQQLLECTLNANIQKLETAIRKDDNDNPNVKNSNDNGVALMINELDNIKITTIQEQKLQEESKLNKNIVASAAISTTTTTQNDEYMTLNSNPNSINNKNDKTPKKNNINMSKLLNDNEKNIIKLQQTNHIDEQQQQNIIQQQKCINRKSTGSNNSNINTNDESGYEMLQIKSDSSLQAHKALNNINNNNNNYNNNNNNIDNKNKLSTNDITTTTATPMEITNATTTQRPRSTNFVTLPSNINNTILFSSSSTSLNTASSQQNQNSKSATPKPITPPPPASRPSSVNLEPHELYYASLDWPQCSNKDALAKANNSICGILTIPKATTNTIVEVIGSGGGGCGILDNNVLPSTTPSVHNVYAKIDFDHSDSSSSSSKNI